jgi:hypothetical protein
MISDISLEIRMLLMPHLRGFREHENIEKVSFICIDISLFHLSQCREEIVFDSIGMYPIVYFGKFSFDIPAKRLLLLLYLLESLKFLYQIELELDRYPTCELEGDIWMCIGTTIPPC